MTLDIAKKAAGYRAAQLIKDHMIVGLGTGSTAAYFIEALILECKKGLKITAVASSQKSKEIAINGNIFVLDLNDVSKIDITVDGADEIDSQKRMIKGGGGAHVREKILAASSSEIIIVIDETKLVSSIGKAKLPVEILPYGSKMTEKKINALGFHGKWRMASQCKPFITDNGNLILDVQFPYPPSSPEKVHEQLKSIPGVVDTGFFFHLAQKVIIGHKDGSTSFL